MSWLTEPFDLRTGQGYHKLLFKVVPEAVLLEKVAKDSLKNSPAE